MIFFTPVDPCDKQESNFGSNFLNFFFEGTGEKEKVIYKSEKKGG
jgi:preprotein translocase subunit SecE